MGGTAATVTELLLKLGAPTAVCVILLLGCAFLYRENRTIREACSKELALLQEARLEEVRASTSLTIELTKAIELVHHRGRG